MRKKRGGGGQRQFAMSFVRNHTSAERSIALSAWLSVSALFITACGGGGGSGSGSSSPPAVAAITVTPSPASVDTSMTVQFTASATDAAGHAVSGVAFTWTSSNANVATIGTSTGLATGIAAGTSEISASANGVTSTALTLTVFSPVRASSQGGPSGTLVQLHGANFTSTSTVTFGAYTANLVEYLSPTTLLAVVPFAVNNGTLSALPAGSYPIQVDGGQSIPYEVTNLLANPNAPGTILKNVLTQLGQLYVANRGTIVTNLQTIQTSSADPNAVAYATNLLALLPELDTYVTSGLANVVSSLDPGALALAESAIYSEMGYPLSIKSMHRARSPAAAPTSTQSGDQWLYNREANIQNTQLVLKGFRDADWVLFTACLLPSPISVAACAIGASLGLVASIVELATLFTEGEVAELDIASDQASFSTSTTAYLDQQRTSQLKSAIVVAHSARVVTVLELFLKSIVDLTPAPSTSPGPDIWKLLSPAIDTLIKMLPGVLTAPTQTLPVAFETSGYVHDWPTYCTTSTNSFPTVACADIASIDNPTEVLSTTYMPPANTTDSVVWLFELDNSVLLPSESTSAIGTFTVGDITIFSSFGPNQTFNTTAPPAADLRPAGGWCVSGAGGTGCTALHLRVIASPFTANDTAGLKQLDLALSYISGTNGVVVQLVADSNGLPGSTVLESWTVAGLPSGIPSPISVVDVSHVLLQGGTQYWIVVAPGAGDTLLSWFGDTLGLSGSVGNIDNGGWALLWEAPNVPYGPGSLLAFDVVGL